VAIELVIPRILRRITRLCSPQLQELALLGPQQRLMLQAVQLPGQAKLHPLSPWFLLPVLPFPF